MEKSTKRLRYAGILVIVVILLLVAVPYIFMGPPSPLISIRNMDNVSHDVKVEILTPQNSSIFQESYLLSPQEKIREQKSLSFLVWKTLPFNMEYVVNVTLDGNASEMYHSRLGQWETVEIMIDDGLSVYSSVA